MITNILLYFLVGMLFYNTKINLLIAKAPSRMSGRMGFIIIALWPVALFKSLFDDE